MFSFLRKNSFKENMVDCDKRVSKISTECDEVSDVIEDLRKAIYENMKSRIILNYEIKNFIKEGKQIG